MLNGGTISSLNGGIWSFGQTVTGNGVITAPFTTTGTVAVTANSNNLPISVSGTGPNPLALSTVTLSFTSTAGSSTGYFNLSNLNVTGLTLGGASGRTQSTNFLPVFNNNLWGNTNYGLLNVTSNSTINGTIAITGSGNSYKVLNITGSTLSLTNPGALPTPAATPRHRRLFSWARAAT